jgi:hypothetical protein
LLLCLLFQTAVLAKTLVTPGRGFGKVTLGASYVDFAQGLGRPKKVQQSGSDPSTKQVYFQDLALLVNREGKVIGITLMSPEYRTSENLGVGSSEASVEKAYGGGLARGEGNRTYPGRGVAFVFRGGHAAYVMIFKSEGGQSTPLLGDRLLIGGARAGDLHLGMSIASVEQAWGRPASSRPRGSRTLVDYKKAHGVCFLVGGGKVDAILVTTSDFISGKGVGVGSRLADVEKVLGPSHDRKEGAIYYPRKGVGFLMAEGTVREVQIIAASR